MPGTQLNGKSFDNSLAILCPFSTLLFVFYDLPPDLPVSTDHLMIDNRLNPIAGGFDDCGDATGKFGYRCLER